MAHGTLAEMRARLEYLEQEIERPGYSFVASCLTSAREAEAKELREAIAKEEALLDARDLAEVLRDVLTYGLRPEVVKEAEKVLARVEGR